MQILNKPKLVLGLLVVVFVTMLGIALYAPAYVASSTSQNPTTLSVTPFSYIHSDRSHASALTNNIPQANYSGLFYVQHVCVYHQ